MEGAKAHRKQDPEQHYHTSYTHKKKKPASFCKGNKHERPHLQSLNCLCVQTRSLCLLTHKEKVLSVYGCTLSMTKTPTLSSLCMSPGPDLFMFCSFMPLRFLTLLSVHSAGVEPQCIPCAHKTHTHTQTQTEGFSPHSLFLLAAFLS